MGVPVAHLVKRWPDELAVPGPIPLEAELSSIVKGIVLHTAFLYHPPIVLICQKYLRKGQIIASNSSVPLAQEH